MIDKKVINNVIKRLDRVIALLDSCVDYGKMAEGTRMRLIEMLHISISDIYSIGKQDEDDENEEIDIKDTCKKIKTLAIIKEETVVDEKAEVEEKKSVKNEVEVKEELIDQKSVV